MDYLKSEEQLVRAQLSVEQELRHLELLSKLSQTYNQLKAMIPEKMPVSMKAEETLSIKDNIVLPLKVIGTMLGIGRHKIRYYTEEELKKAVPANAGKRIPVKLDHKKDEAASTIGLVDRIFWDDVKKAIMFEAHINDETQARNVLDGAVNQVSAGILSVPALDIRLGVVGKDLEFTELSFVEEGAFKGNTVEALI